MLDWVEVGALAGPLKDICIRSCVVLSVLLGSLSCWKEIFALCSVQLSLNPDQSPRLLNNTPAPWCCHHHASPLGWSWAGDERCLVSFRHGAQNWGQSSSISSILVSSNQKILFLTVWQPFRVFLETPSGLSRVFPVTEERLPSGHFAMKPRSVEHCSDGCPSGSVSHLHTGSLELGQSDHRILSHLSYEALVPWLVSLAGQAALGRTLVVPNFFHLRIMEATVLLGTFHAADLPQICASTQSCLWR